jgi:hypothetical protein
MISHQTYEAGYYDLMAENKSLMAQLAEREAEIAVLREALLGFVNYPADDADYPPPYRAAHKALSTPQSSSYLEQWEKDRFGEPVGYVSQNGLAKFESTVTYWTLLQKESDAGFSLPLYARKEQK